MEDKKKKEKNQFEKLLDNLKIKYLDGKNPIGRTMTGYGFLPSKNVALNIGRMMGVPYDRELHIRKNDPANTLRNMTRSIGGVERIHNTYLTPRVKLAD